MLPGRTRSESGGESSGDGGDSGGLRRLLLVAGAVAAAAYLVLRVRSSGSERPPRPQAQPIDVGRAGGGRSREGDAAGGGEGGASRLDDETAAERAVEGAEESPAPPGEMDVAEELAEEALDDGEGEAGDEAAGSDAEDAETGE